MPTTRSRRDTLLSDTQVYSKNTKKSSKDSREAPMCSTGTCGGKKKRWGVATMYLWFIIAPIFIWILLFSMKPSFVSDNVNGQQVISQQRLLLWTMVFTVISWVIIYSIYYCRY